MLTKTFILAGKAIFTISNGKQGDAAADYTYRVSHKPAKGDYPENYLVALLTGPDNEADYTYLGVLDPATGRIRLTAKSAYPASAKPVIALGWALGHVWAGATELPHGATIRHAGRCGKCARLLTVPESIESGLGPECSGKGYTQPRNEGRKPRAARGSKKAAAEALANATEAVREIVTGSEPKVTVALGRAFSLAGGDQAKLTEVLRHFAEAGALSLAELIAAGKLVNAHFAAVDEAAASHAEAA